jgi:arylsulfatase A-like enzyme
VYGTVYTAATKNKGSEHGGFSFGDTNVALIVSSPAMRQQVVKTPVLSSQVAATILKSLNLDPAELQAVREEGIQPLPFLSGRADRH